MPSGAIRKRKAYLVAGGAGLLLAAGYLGISLELPFGHLDQPGAGVFPVVAGATLIVASLITVWEGRRLAPVEMIEMPHGADLRRLLSLIVLLVVYFIALPWLGQFISSTIFCVLLMRALSDLTWPRIAIYSLLICGALYVLFVMLLKVPLPRGALLGY